MSGKILTTAVCLGLLGSIAWAGGAEDPATADLDLHELVEVRIRVATREPQRISRAPATASVITADQIAEMGASNLDQVLETVAGLHVLPSKTRSLDPVYSIRGIQSSPGGQVLILINGVPISELAEGGLALGFNLPVSGIQRIEVIRGPGSAVYGADAFAGVIDIITKSRDDIDGTEVGVRAGSFDSVGAWFLHGDRWGGWDVALTFDWRQTDGDDDRVLPTDRQTVLDQLFGTTASLAPGSLATDYEVADLHLELARPQWTARLWGWHSDRGMVDGAAQALDPVGRQESSQLLLDVSHRQTTGDGAWELTQQLSHSYIDQAADARLFPPGAVLPIGSDGNVDFATPVGLVSFPDGVFGRPSVRDNTTSLDAVAVWTRPRHHLRLSAGFRSQDLKAQDKRNFGSGVIDGTEPVVDGTLSDVTGTSFAFIPDVDRDHWWLSVQDQWTINDEWQFTVGARYDDYSDFGGTFNPRVAVVWQVKPELTAKLLYGSAFRGPSFGQQFNRNNPAFLGNPNLDPETSDTLELAFDCRPARSLRTVLTLYAYEVEDLIDVLPDPGATTSTAQNASDQDGYGTEFELYWEPTEKLRIDSNLAWQHSEDEATGRRIQDAPEHQLFGAARWRFAGDWMVRGQLNYLGERSRPAGDPRPPLGAYATADVTLKRGNLPAGLELALIGRNLFDEDGREPADAVLPEDYPIAGRAIYLQASFAFP